MKRTPKPPKIPFDDLPLGGQFEFLGKIYRKTGSENASEILQHDDGRETYYLSHYFAPTCHVRPKEGTP